jgi:catechol 2,3-dioxygenase-like lactoylglutathione lyase family enzyme
MAALDVTRPGVVLAVADVARSVAFYERLGFVVDALYEEPAFAILVGWGMRLSLAEQGHPAEDRPGVSMIAPEDRSRMPVVLVLEVRDVRAEHAALAAEGVPFLTEPLSPPWGGCRVFAVDPDGFPVELEQLA